MFLGYVVMIDKIYDYIKGNGRAVFSCELVENVLNIKGANDEISDGLIKTIVGNDNRFIRDKEGWSVSKHKRHAGPVH